MKRPTLSTKAVALAFAALFHSAGGAAAASIPAHAAQDPKTLWRLVMESYYGPYDKALKCWTARIAEDHVCMRPQRLDRITVRNSEHLFLAIGGTRIGQDGEFQTSHADSGVLGLLVLKADGPTLRLVAKNDLHAGFGSFGNPPSEESIAVREVGPNDTYGWVVSDGWMGQGHVITYSNILAPIGDTIVGIGSIPVHYDNSGNCENGKIIGSDTACTDYSGELLFDSADTSGRFYPLILKVTGTREGTVLDQAFTTSFDPGKLTYKAMQGLPEEFANGI